MSDEWANFICTLPKITLADDCYVITATLKYTYNTEMSCKMPGLDSVQTDQCCLFSPELATDLLAVSFQIVCKEQKLKLENGCMILNGKVLELRITS